MGASTFGNFGKYGITDESAKGLHAASLSIDISPQYEVEIPNHLNNVIGYVQGEDKATISLSGVTVNAATTSQALAAVLDTANTDIYGTDTAVTVFLVNSLNLARTNAGVEEGTVGAVGWEGQDDATATAVT